MDNYKLIADIGGTHIRCAITNKQLQKPEYTIINKCTKFPSIDVALLTYLNTLPVHKKPTKGLIAIAADTHLDTITMTNHNWQFSKLTLKKQLNFSNLDFINDFVAHANAVNNLCSSDIITLKEGTIPYNATTHNPTSQNTTMSRLATLKESIIPVITAEDNKMGFASSTIITKNTQLGKKKLRIKLDKDEDISKIINPTVVETTETKAILGPGTGLGAALILNQNATSIIIPSEAGHMIIGFRTDFECEIQSIIQKNIGEVYAEALISGQGLKNIYKALGIKYNQPINEALSAEDISNLAISKNSLLDNSLDKLPKKQASQNLLLEGLALNLFFSFLGTFTSNIAVTFLPYGGIYLGGGILPKLQTQLMTSDFINNYQNRVLPTVATILEEIPLYLITNKHSSLIGLAKVAWE